MQRAPFDLLLGYDDRIRLGRVGRGDRGSHNDRVRNRDCNVGRKPAVTEGAEVETRDPNGADDVH